MAKVRICTDVELPDHDGGNGNGDDNGNGNGNGGHTELRSFVQSIGDGTSTEYTVTHGLATRYALFCFIEQASGRHLDPEIVTVDDNQITVTFEEAPAEGAVEAFGLALPLPADDHEDEPEVPEETQVRRRARR